MHPLKWIRENPDVFDKAMARRKLPAVSVFIRALDDSRRELQTKLQSLQAERNQLAKLIPLLKKEHKDSSEALSRANTLKNEISSLESQEQEILGKLQDFLASLPNMLDDRVPSGADAQSNQLIRCVGDKPTFSFPPRQHFEIGEMLGEMDFETAAAISGARFTVLKGGLAQLERALGNFMLDVHCEEFGYQEVSPPLLVKSSSMFGTGQLPKFAEDLFKVSEERWLIPTSEVSLTNLVRGRVLEEDQLPLRFAAFTPNFRSEAGAAGRDTRGLIRQHQFYKVELVSITTPEQSDGEHERMRGAAEEILKRLGLPYRVVRLCDGDMGFSASMTYDLEVWLPGQDQYREIASHSNCKSFQAQRMEARYRKAAALQTKAQEKRLDYVHTLNGSGIAVGRALVAILENYQESDGSVRIPEALQPYMRGKERLTPR